ncbi:hypothetical protein FJTKL_00391 [Diaporthe vaccinii]|uniref:Uncharacterized protein n=1 Tax=Diaporthe vaccinii TaxID=105482 RepID=A0ABR4E341_9PEZI
MVCTPISAYWGITANVGVNGRNPYCLNQSTATTVYRMVKVIQFLGSTDPIADFTVLSIFTLLEFTIGIVSQSACQCAADLRDLI